MIPNKVIAHNPEATMGCIMWKDILEEWRNKYKEVRKWSIVSDRIKRGSPDWDLAKPMEPLMKPNVYVKVQYIHDAQQIFDALGLKYRWLCVPNSDLPLALVQERDGTPEDNDLVVLVAPRVEV